MEYWFYKKQVITKIELDKLIKFIKNRKRLFAHKNEKNFGQVLGCNSNAGKSFGPGFALRRSGKAGAKDPKQTFLHLILLNVLSLPFDVF